MNALLDILDQRSQMHYRDLKSAHWQINTIFLSTVSTLVSKMYMVLSANEVSSYTTHLSAHCRQQFWVPVRRYSHYFDSMSEKKMCINPLKIKFKKNYYFSNSSIVKSQRRTTSRVLKEPIPEPNICKIKGGTLSSSA